MTEPVALKKAMTSPRSTTDGTYCVDSGTTNVVVLTSAFPGAAIAEWIDGMTFWFIAAGTNTSDVTLARDGLDPVEVVTITGSVLPAGYLRTDAPTRCRYDAATGRVIADREIERGSNANGDYVKFADGLALTHIDGIQSNNGTATYTFGGVQPLSFSSLTVYPSLFCYTAYHGSGPNGLFQYDIADASTTPTGTFKFAQAVLSGDVVNRITTTGNWYEFVDPDA